MAHITSIGAGMFSDLSVHAPSTELTASGLAALDTAAEFQALFATEIANNGGTKAAGAFIRLADIREFPAIGTPANVVNVPAYGQATSSQIQGQADAPSMELTINYIPGNWADGTSLLADMIGDGIQRVMRFTLLNSNPTGTGATKFASTAGGLGTVPNSQFYFIGKLEAIAVNPQLTDANTATLTLTVQGAFWGAYTV
jgi:hypothetical protein